VGRRRLPDDQVSAAAIRRRQLREREACGIEMVPTPVHWKVRYALLGQGHGPDEVSDREKLGEILAGIVAENLGVDLSSGDVLPDTDTRE
jgi:hypothetical protein